MLLGLLYRPDLSEVVPHVEGLGRRSTMKRCLSCLRSCFRQNAFTRFVRDHHCLIPYVCRVLKNRTIRSPSMRCKSPWPLVASNLLPSNRLPTPVAPRSNPLAEDEELRKDTRVSYASVLGQKLIARNRTSKKKIRKPLGARGTEADLREI